MVQEAAPAVEEYPPPHAVHPAALLVPLFVTAPRVPGAQMVQAATDVLPATEFVVQMPVGHAVQLVAPAAA